MSEQVEREKLSIKIKSQEQRVNQLENLSSIISHEMRTPLSSSLQFLELIEKIIGGKKEQKFAIQILRYLQLIKYSLNMNLSFVSDLLDMRMFKER